MKKKKPHRKPLSHEKHCVEVATRHWLGDSLRDIAKSLKIGKDTVYKSLALPEAKKVFEDLDNSIIERTKKDRYNLSLSFECWLRKIEDTEAQKMLIYADLIKAIAPILIQKPAETIQQQQASPEIIKFMREFKNDEL